MAKSPNAAAMRASGGRFAAIRTQTKPSSAIAQRRRAGGGQQQRQGDEDLCRSVLPERLAGDHPRVRAEGERQGEREGPAVALAPQQQEHQDARDRGEQRRRELLHDLGDPVDLRLLPAVRLEPAAPRARRAASRAAAPHRIEGDDVAPRRAHHPVDRRAEVGSVALDLRLRAALPVLWSSDARARPAAGSRRDRACGRAARPAGGTGPAACRRSRSSGGWRCRRTRHRAPSRSGATHLGRRTRDRLGDSSGPVESGRLRRGCCATPTR